MTDTPALVEVQDWRRARQEHEHLLRFWRSPLGLDVGALMLLAGRRSAEVMAAAARGEDIIEAAMRQGPPLADLPAAERHPQLAPVAADATAQIETAPTWFVDLDMTTLVCHAAKSMPGEPMLRTDVPTPNGFLYLATPVWLTTNPDGELEVEPAGDPDYNDLPHRAFHWAVVDNRVDVVCYRSRGEYATREDPLSAEDEALMAPLMPAVEFSWTFGEESWTDTSDIPQVARFLKALWTISQQRVADLTTPALPRADRRRAQRLNLPKELVVVTLRRPARPTHEDQPVRQVDWTHRWIVGGHWRNQHLPSTGTHRLQWINDHVKGPDDKPLVVKGRVFNVTR